MAGIGRPNPPANLERKNLHTFVKVLDATQGIVEMYVAGTNNIDDGNDRFAPGAFNASIASRKPKGIHGHDWLLATAKTLEAEEVLPGDARLPQKMKDANAGGVRLKAQYNLDTQVGRESFSNVRFYGDEQEWSVGYIAEDFAVDPETGVREIKTASLWEFSDVLWGMNPVTSTVSVKAGYGTAGSAVPVDWTDDVNRYAWVLKTWLRAEAEWKAKMSQADANYRDAGGSAKTCSACEHFIPAKAGIGTCEIVKGLIAPGWTCDQYAAAKAADDVEDKVAEGSWDGSSSRFTDAQWKDACAACEGKSDAPKTDCYLPHHEPAGAVSRAGVHAAAARFNQTTRAHKDTAKSHLAGHYKNQLSEDVPEVLGGAAKDRSDLDAALLAIDLALPLIEAKDGRVLSAAHYDKLQSAHDAIGAVLDAHSASREGKEALPEAPEKPQDAPESDGAGDMPLDPSDLLEFQKIAAGIGTD